VRNLAVDLGAPGTVAHAVWLAIGVVLLAACAFVARRGDDLSSFILAIAAALALSPLVWLHYFAFLSVAVAAARPRLGPAWFVPLAMIVATGRGNPTALQTVVALAAAAITVALALRDARQSPRPSPADDGATLTPASVT
jgi:hypothetical protein